MREFEKAGWNFFSLNEQIYFIDKEFSDIINKATSRNEQISDSECGFCSGKLIYSKIQC